MPYQIDRYNGSFFIEVPDQTVDSSSCDMKLIGKNYAGYGEVTNENILHLLENFRGFSAPRRPITGQLWYDELTNKIKFYDDTQQWKTVSVTDVALTAPTGLSTKDKGNLWYNDTLKQLNVWDGADYVAVGPELAAGFGETKFSSGTIRDNGNVEHAIIRVLNNEQVIATISSTEFDIGVIDTITGFTTIKQGFTLVNTPTTGVTTSVHRYWGTSSNSDKFSGFTTADFVMRGINGSTFGDTGVTLGDDSDLKIFVEDFNKVVISSQLNGPLKIRIKNGTINNDVAIFTEAGMEPNTTQVYNLGSAVKEWNEIHTKDLFGNVQGTLQGDLLAEDDQVMFDASLKEFYGTHIGTQQGDIRAANNALCFDSSARAFFGAQGTFTNITTDLLTLIDRVIGDLKGDIYATDDTIAYNAGTKTFTGTLTGNAATASKLQSPKFINGTPFDGSENITVVDETRVAKDGSIMTGYLTLVDDPLLEKHAATKKYVDDQIANKTLYFSLDTKGLSTIGAGVGSVAGLLNQLAPPLNFRVGTMAHIASTIQNVSTSVSVSRGDWISISYVSNVSATTTVNNPSRNNLLIYRVNSIQSSWEYVSG
jgi:hypothetical protein